MQLAPYLPVDAQALTSYSGGLRGVAQTINVMRRMVEDYKTDPTIRHSAVATIFNTVAPKDEESEARALFAYVQDTIRYVRDINGVETIATPDRTLLTRVGDCDDQSLLLATLLEAVGYPTRFVVAGYFEPGHVEHVYLQCLAAGRWWDCDPTERGVFGEAPAGAVALYIEGT